MCCKTTAFEDGLENGRGSVTAVRRAVIVAAVMSLMGCGTSDRIRPSSIATGEVEARHPIVLAQDRTSIDIFPSHGREGLDRHSAKQIVAFAQEYQQGGRGPVVVLLPRGAGLGDQRQIITDIGGVLRATGVRAGLTVSSYPIGDPTLASPVRLSFQGLRAKVADQCGQWPQDLGSASSIEGWQNKQYYNFGCATQTMIAAQVADPRDLVTPRGEEPADTLIRSRAIENIRKGTDPSTAWSTHATTIGTVGGN